MKNNNLFNQKDLKSFRSFLRNKATSAEAALWDILKSKQLDGRKFRRQYSIGIYIVDFCCPSENLLLNLMEIPMGNIIKYRKMKIEISTLRALDSLC